MSNSNNDFCLLMGFLELSGDKSILFQLMEHVGVQLGLLGKIMGCVKGYD